MRLHRWLQKNQVLRALDLPMPNFETFERVCPRHGRVTLRRLRHGATQCQACGYELRGLRGCAACPECGWGLPVAMREALGETEESDG